MFCKVGLGVIILPIATLYFSDAELAYYLFLNVLLGMAYLAEGGLNRVILRATTYFKLGADIIPNDIDSIKSFKHNSTPNYKKLGELLRTSFVLYICLAVLSLLILYSFGTVLVKNLLYKQSNLEHAYYSFYLLGVYTVIYIIQLRWIGLIQGLGFLASQKKMEIFFSILRVLLVCSSIIFGLGVLCNL